MTTPALPEGPLLYSLEAASNRTARERQLQLLSGSGQPFMDLRGPLYRRNIRPMLLRMMWLALGDDYAPDLAALELLLEDAEKPLSARSLEALIAKLSRLLSGRTDPNPDRQRLIDQLYVIRFWGSEDYHFDGNGLLAWLAWRIHARYGLHLAQWQRNGEMLGLALVSTLPAGPDLSVQPFPQLDRLPTERLTQPPLNLEQAQRDDLRPDPMQPGDPQWISRKHGSGVTVRHFEHTLSVTLDNGPALTLTHPEARALAACLSRVQDMNLLQIGQGDWMYGLSRNGQTVSIHWKALNELDVAYGQATVPLKAFRVQLSRGTDQPLSQTRPAKHTVFTASAVAGSRAVSDHPGVQLCWSGQAVTLSPDAAEIVAELSVLATVPVVYEGHPTVVRAESVDGALGLMFWPRSAAPQAPPSAQIEVPDQQRSEFAEMLRTAATAARLLPDLSEAPSPQSILNRISEALN